MINSDHPAVDAARVAPGLWIGSHPAVPGHRCPRHRNEFAPDLRQGGFTFLVLCAVEYQPPAAAFPGVQVVHAPFNDDPGGIGGDQLQTALNAAEQSARAIESGHRVLITCMEGRNRSGLVTALALSAVTGMSCARAGEVVRDKRGLGALTNMAFRKLLGRVELDRGGLPCDLCKAEPITRRYYEDEVCWIADCKDCRVPMVVYKRHGVLPPRQHLNHMFAMLSRCGQGARIDTKRGTIPDHFHAHLRPV